MQKCLRWAIKIYPDLSDSDCQKKKCSDKTKSIIISLLHGATESKLPDEQNKYTSKIIRQTYMIEFHATQWQACKYIWLQHGRTNQGKNEWGMTIFQVSGH